jgi:hypothetical protein
VTTEEAAVWVLLLAPGALILLALIVRGYHMKIKVHRPRRDGNGES